MKKILVIISFLVFTIHLTAQPVWQWQNPNPPAGNFKSISMIDTTEGWMAVCTQAGGNSLMHYYNGQWNSVNVPTTISMVSPSSVFFLSHTCGWVGSISRINKFNGSTWSPISGVSGSVKDMFFFNQNSGWAVLGGGRVFKVTGNSGVTSTVTTSELNAISFPDSLHGWAVGESGTILSYYGGSWYTWPVITTQDLYDVCFTDMYHGWAVGDSGTVLYFNGTNWQVQNSGVNFDLTSMDFVDQTHGYAGGYGDSLIFYNGTSWSNYCSAATWITSLDMVNSSRGFASGFIAAIDIIANNSSISFIQSNLTNNGLTGMCFKDNNHGWVVGNNGTILTYLQGTWSILDPVITNAHLWGVHFPDIQHGWVVGEGGTIINYNYGNWNGQVSGTGSILYGVHFTDSLNGWAVGWEGAITHYHNNTWVTEESNTDSCLLSVFFTDTTNGWAVGEYGTIVHYTNGAWQPYHSGRGAYLNSVYFLTPDNGWAVGDSGMIMHYDGISWQVDTMMPYALWKYPRSVHFVTPDNGWAVGMQCLYHYDGYSWTDYSYTLPTGYNFTVISFPDEGNGWIAGVYGHILYCKNPSTIQTEILDITDPIIFNEVYPNPCESKCVFTIPNKEYDRIYFKIFGLSGQEFKVNYTIENIYNESKLIIDVSTLEQGLYFLSVQTNNENIVRKIIKK